MWKPVARMIVGTLFAATLACGSARGADTGLVAHYTFDEGKGAVAKDGSGNGNHGAFKGGLDRFCRRGEAACESDWGVICTTHNLLKLFRSGKARWN